MSASPQFLRVGFNHLMWFVAWKGEGNKNINGKDMLTWLQMYLNPGDASLESAVYLNKEVISRKQGSLWGEGKIQYDGNSGFVLMSCISLKSVFWSRGFHRMLLVYKKTYIRL